MYLRRQQFVKNRYPKNIQKLKPERNHTEQNTCRRHDWCVWDSSSLAEVVIVYIFKHNPTNDAYEIIEISNQDFEHPKFKDHDRIPKCKREFR